MHRYRKGAIWRPPSAADSAAHADAAEAHRRAPAQPQDADSPGQIIVVTTPAAGIDARDADTVYWALCKRSIQTVVADEHELVDTDEDIVVHNLFDVAIDGDERVTTALTDCGTRYVIQQPVARKMAILTPNTWIHSGAGSGAVFSGSDEINPNFVLNTCYGDLANVGIELETVTNPADRSFKFVREGVYDLRAWMEVSPTGSNWLAAWTATDVTIQTPPHAQYDRFNDSSLRAVGQVRTTGDLNLYQDVKANQDGNTNPAEYAARTADIRQSAVTAGTAGCVIRFFANDIYAGSTAEVALIFRLEVERIHSAESPYWMRSDYY